MKKLTLKKKLLSLLLITFLPLFSLAEQIILASGDSKKFTLKGQTVWIEKKAIITGSVQGRHLQITGKETGSSYLKINDTLYLVQVVAPQNLNLFKKMSELLNKKLGLKIQTKNSQIQISGTLYKLNDWIEISKLVTSDESYTFKAFINESLQPEIDSYFSKLFRSRGIPEQKIQIASSPLLRLHPQDPHITEYEETLRPFGVKIIKDKTSLTLAPVVKVQITVAEINRSYTQKFGVEFSESYKAEVLPVSKIKNFEADLHFLETSGKGRLLASPNIICRSGKEAEFLAGGEFPIRTRSKFGSDVTWKKYGIFLKVQPKADSLGRMSIGIQSEVSSLDKSNSVDDIPAISTNKVSSYFDLTDSKVIALSGLLTDMQGGGYRGLSFLSRLPIIGSLVSSQDFISKRTELIIFVKPSIMKMHEEINKSKIKPQHLGDI